MKQKSVFEPIRNLYPGTAILAFPFAVGFMLLVKTLSFFVTAERGEVSRVPRNAILYSTHLDVISATINPTLHRGPLIVVGYHAFLAYLYIVWDRVAGIGHLCYHRVSDVPPLDQLQAMFRKYPEHRFWIFTDSGGPYGRVRKSLVILSRESGRPTVAARLKASRFFHLLGHRIPSPFSRVTITFAEPVTAAELSALSPEAARDRLQAQLDSL